MQADWELLSRQVRKWNHNFINLSLGFIIVCYLVEIKLFEISCIKIITYLH